MPVDPVDTAETTEQEELESGVEISGRGLMMTWGFILWGSQATHILQQLKANATAHAELKEGREERHQQGIISLAPLHDVLLAEGIDTNKEQVTNATLCSFFQKNREVLMSLTPITSFPKLKREEMISTLTAALASNKALPTPHVLH